MYQRHGDDSFVVEKIHIFEFIARLIRHIPEANFKTICSYGFYSSKRHPFYHLVRKMIHKTKVAFYKSLNTWRNLVLTTFKKDPLLCSCGTIMKFIEFVPPLER